LAFDNTGGSVLGVALSSVAATNISVTIRDENGTGFHRCGPDEIVKRTSSE
jgi:hypothetical protein